VSQPTSSSDDGRWTPTDELRRRRAAHREPGAVLVPDAAGGDPIPWEEPPGSTAGPGGTGKDE